MVAGKSTEWLPPGFTEKVKYRNGRKIKYYYNAATGAKFHSKKDVINCATTEIVLHDTPQATSVDDNSRPSNNNADAILAKINDSPAWLPDGCTMEEKTYQSGSSKGKTYKVYVDLSSGRKFGSRSAMARYLNAVDHANILSGQTRQTRHLAATDAKIHSEKDVINFAKTEKVSHYTPQATNGHDSRCPSNNNADAMLAKTNDTPAWLPGGWIMEEKTYQSGSSKGKTYKVYSDLSSGKKFSSRSAVTRYLNAVDYAKTLSGQTRQTRQHAATGAEFHSEKDVVICATTEEVSHYTPQATNVHDTRCPSNNNADAMLAKANDSPACLPGGWIMEEKTYQSGSSKEKTYKVYADLSTGKKFDSRSAVIPYLNAVDHANTSSRRTRQTRLNKLDNEGELSSKADISLQHTSVENAICVAEKRSEGDSFVTVATEITSADGLPPGWIKEIRTKTSANRIRKDPYYIDPVSGYEFRSKPDAMRYLKTNDIHSCACKPKRRELNDLKLTRNEITLSEQSPDPANENVSKHLQNNGQLFLGREINGGGNSSIIKSKGETGYKTAEMKNRRESANEVSKQNPRAMAEDLAICSTVTDPSIKQNLLENGRAEQTDKIQGVPKKSRKRKTPTSLPSRVSKRLAGSEPEIVSNSIVVERALRAAKKSSAGVVDSSPGLLLKASATITPHSDTEPAKEVLVDRALQMSEPLGKIETPPVENQAIPEKQPGGPANGKQLDDGGVPQEVQFGDAFGDICLEPCYELAFKALKGEISLEELGLSGGFEGQLDIPYNLAEGCSKPLQSDVPFQNEAIIPPSEASKQHATVDLLPNNSSLFSAWGNISFPTFSSSNTQSGFPTFSSSNTQSGFPAFSSSNTQSGFPTSSSSHSGQSGFPTFSSSNIQSGFPTSSSPSISGFPTFSSSSSQFGFPTFSSFDIQSGTQAANKDTQTRFNPSGSKSKNKDG